MGEWLIILFLFWVFFFLLYFTDLSCLSCLMFLTVFMPLLVYLSNKSLTEQQKLQLWVDPPALPYTLPFGRTVPPLARLVSSPLESRVVRSLLPPVRGSTASSVPLAPGSSLKTGLSSSSSGILSRLSSEMRDRACSFFRRPGRKSDSVYLREHPGEAKIPPADKHLQTMPAQRLIMGRNATDCVQATALFLIS